MAEVIPITLKAKDKRELVKNLRFGASLNCEIQYLLGPQHARLMADCIEDVLNIEDAHKKRLADFDKIRAEIAPKIRKNLAILAVQVVMTAALWASLFWGAS